MNYLFIDTETTGTNPLKHEVLTAYFGVYNENMEFIDELDLMLKPDHGDISKIIYDSGAAEVTGINLSEHLKDPNTITYSEGKAKILALFEKNKIPKKRRHYRLSGQNVDFDKNFLISRIMDIEEWEKYVHHNTLDTLRICTFLQDIGFIPSDLGNLASLVEYFGIPMGKAHNAKEDTKMAVEVYKAMKKMLSSKKNDLSGISEHSLLNIVEL